MKYIFIILGVAVLLFACSNKSIEETTIREYLENRQGVKTDLKIKFLSIETFDVTVADSITILKKEFNTYTAKKIKNAETAISDMKASIKKQAQSNDRIVAKIMIKTWTKELKELERDLKQAQNIEQTNLKSYSTRNASDILVKRVKTTFSFFNTNLQTNQEIEADFLLSTDGKTCLLMIR